MTSDRAKTIDTLSALLHQTSEDHHVAYAATDGVDPDWSIWYAGHLLELGIEKLLDATLLKSELIYLLVGAERRMSVEAPGAHWERWYAAHLADTYLH
jgi:hypothetical protein